MLLVIKQTYTYACCLLLLLGSWTISGYAQSADYSKAYTNIIPPAPEAANLGKYVETPVDLSSGQPSVSIPIHTIKGKEISVPVSLSYRSGGIKVEESASWVGLGWTLNAGGVITRTVYGHPDGHKQIKCHFDTGEYDKFQKFMNGKPTGCGSNEFASFEAFYNYQKDITTKQDIDTEPDIYFFNFNGYSGKLFLDENFQPHIMSYQPLKIEPYRTSTNFLNDRGPQSWKITTPDGTQYFFDITSKTTTQYTVNAKDVNLDYISSWYLSKIVSPNHRDTITFEYYNAGNILSDNNYYQMEYRKVSIGGEGCENEAVSESSTFSATSGTANQELYLRAIKSSLGDSVVMNAPFGIVAEKRTDRKSDFTCPLKGVKIYNAYGSLLREALFHQSYFVSLGGTTAPTDIKYRYYRLRLDSITFQGEVTYPVFADLPGNASPSLANNGQMSYKFGYNSTLLPDRFSKSQDYWGYYNGKPNITLIPAMTVNGINYDGANRNPDPNFAQASILNKVTYPTKGYKIFEFEGHSVDDTSPTAGTSTLSKTVTISSGGVHAAVQHPISGYINPETNGGNTIENRRSFYKHMTITYEEGDTTPQLVLTATDDNGVAFSGEQIYSAFNVYVVKVSDDYYNCDNSITIPLTAYDPAKVVYQQGGPGGGFAVTETNLFETQGYGTYQVLIANSFPHFRLQAQYTVTRKTAPANSYPARKVGGLRIKTIKGYDFNGSQINEKRFLYELTTTFRTKNPNYRRLCPYAGLPLDENGLIILDSIPAGYTPPVADTNQYADLSFKLRSGVEILKYGLEDHYQFSKFIQKECAITGDPTSISTSQGAGIWVMMGNGSGTASAAQILPKKECNYLERFARGRSQLGSLGGNHIAYRTVVEQNIDFVKDKGNGFVVHNFRTKKGRGSAFPYTAPDHTSTIYNGQLLNKRVFDADSVLLVEELNEYAPEDSTKTYASITGFKTGPHLTTYHQSIKWGRKLEPLTGCTSYYHDCDLYVYSYVDATPMIGYQDLQVSRYALTSERGLYLTKSITRSFDIHTSKVKWGQGLGETKNYIESSKIYEYVADDLYAPLVRSVTTTTSRNNEWLKEVNYYPFDNHSLLGGGSMAAYATMKNRHWIGKVVGKQTLHLEGSDLASATATPIHQLREDYKIAVGNQLQLDQVAVALDGQNLTIRLKEFTYDAAGNLLGYQKDGFYTALQWGYQGLYPTAQIVGAQAKDCFYTSFEGPSGGGNSAEAKTGQKSRQTNQVLNLMNLTNGKYVLSYWQKNGPVWTEQKSVHEVTSGSFQHTIVATAAQPIDEVRFYPLGTQMTTYTYLPGIGQSSVTAPNGQSMYYSYDQLGRLLYTRDFEKNVLQTYEYHFKND